MKAVLLIIFVSFSIFAKEDLELMSLPLENDAYHVVFAISSNDNCTFDRTSDVLPYLIHQKKRVKNLDFFEKLYFSVEELNIKNKEVSFSLAGSSNVRFKFSLKNCRMEKTLSIDDQEFPFDKINLNYTTALGPPVMRSFSLYYKESQKIIHSYSLKGHIPFYELTIGPAMSLRNNLRPGNTRTFLKNETIVEPIPAFLFRYAGFFINRDGAGHALGAYEGLLLLASVFYDGEKFRNPDFHERRNGFFLGPILQWGGFKVKYVKDYFQNIRGEELKITFSHEFRPHLNLKIIPRIYWQRWSKKYSNYYFGVSADEGAGRVEPYGLSYTDNFSVMCRVIYSKEKIAYLADFGAKFLDKDVYKSPIIQGKLEKRLVLGILYRVF